MKLLVGIVSLFALNSCNTLIGLGRDTKEGYFWIQGKLQEGEVVEDAVVQDAVVEDAVVEDANAPVY